MYIYIYMITLHPRYSYIYIYTHIHIIPCEYYTYNTYARTIRHEDIIRLKSPVLAGIAAPSAGSQTQHNNSNVC